MGRDPSAILRLYNVNGRITAGEVAGRFIGDQDHWVQQLRQLHDEHRIDALVFWPDGDDHARQLEAYAELATAVRTCGESWSLPW